MPGQGHPNIYPGDAKCQAHTVDEGLLIEASLAQMVANGSNICIDLLYCSVAP